MKPIVIAILAFVLATGLPALAQNASKQTNNAEEATRQLNASSAPVDKEKQLQRIETYLNGLSTIVADFSQVAADGAVTSGKFYLKRPGKMRWQYEPPTPVLMIANGNQLVYYDFELEQVSYIPINDTLASFLARERINLSDPLVSVDALETSPGIVRLKLSQSDKPEAGRLTLEFSDSPLQIRKMIVTDAQDITTTVALNNARFGVKLEEKLFVFKDPKFFKEKF